MSETNVVSTESSPNQLPEPFIPKIAPAQSLPNVGLEPMRGRILVKLDAFRYTGRIHIPDNAKRIPTTGMVIAFGEGVTQVKLEETVVFGLYSGTALKFQNTPQYRVLTEDEILCRKTMDFEVGELVEEGA